MDQETKPPTTTGPGRAMKPRPVVKMLLMLLALLALLAAIWAGLIRIGWQWPALRPRLPMVHGPLMVSGFFGTLIGLERAVALAALARSTPGRLWPYAAPVLSALGAALLIAGRSDPVGPLLMALGSLVMVAIFGVIFRRQPAVFNGVMGLGALSWLTANVAWLMGAPIPYVVLGWAGFLVLTIVGERLEMSRLLRPDRFRSAGQFVALAAFLGGLLLSAFFYDAGMRLAGLGMTALAAWLFRYDLARRTVRKKGLPRFIAVCLLSGYAWMAVSGALALAFGGVVAGPRYDAVLHAVFLGFVFALVFGHAPIIFPAVLTIPVPYRPAFYAHLVLLDLSLLLRIAGDLAGWVAGRQWGALLNAVAILLFLGNTVLAALAARNRS